ncbi:hypothetical protein B0H14DRAFT_2644293 [Mycena olivaceomarginata]|nr:hypothetical protein B0H14DRAFT_2644293 [Mycena olivaceomarginata]
MSSPNTTPPPRSPCRVTDDLLDLAQQITPSKQSRALREIRLNLQSRANDLRDDISAMKRRPHRLREPGRSHAGRKAACSPSKKAFFLVDDTVFEVEEDEDFDEGTEFSTDKNKIQGQLHQVLRYLPNDAKPFRSTTLVSGAFADGMSGQRSTTSNRLRDASLAKIVDDIKPFTSSSSRFNAFSELIGYQPGTETRSMLPYSTIYASLIRGPSGAVGLFDGQSKRPAAKTIERMHHIHCALPGAIANSAILAIWLHSADTTLTEIGDQTSINYRTRHSYYLQHIVEALASNKAWAVDLLAYWNRILFPDADSPNGADGSARRSRVPGRPAFILPHRRLPAVSHPPHPLCNVRLQHPRAGRSRKFASRLRTAAIPVPRGICSATARVNVVVERPV